MESNQRVDMLQHPMVWPANSDMLPMKVSSSGKLLSPLLAPILGSDLRVPSILNFKGGVIKSICRIIGSYQTQIMFYDMMQSILDTLDQECQAYGLLTLWPPSAGHDQTHT